MNTEQKNEGLNQAMNRREAIKIMTLSMAGLAFGGSLLQGCSSGKSKAAAASAFSYTPAPDGSRITSRTWPGLGQSIGLLGLGCMRLPSLPGGGWGAQLDQDKVNEMVDYALAHGINYFDTAPAYGDSERAMGVALSRYERSSYLLATKMSNFPRGPQGPDLASSKAMFETSLANLQTDYIDFFLLHALGKYSDFEQRFLSNGVMDYILSLKESGQIKYMGFSFHGSVKDLETLLATPYKWDFVQIQMNYLDWKGADAETMYNMLAERGIPVAVMEPIRGGALANVNDSLRSLLSERHPELSPAGTALTFVSSFPGVMVTLSGMSNMEQLKENVATFTDFKPFNDQDNEFLMNVARLYRENPHIPCTGCAYCMPCPNGVNIPGNFAVYNSASDALALPDPNGEKGSEFKKKSKDFLKKYHKEIAEGTGADACTNCKACLSKCPQHLPINDYLKKMDDLIAQL